MKSKIEKVLEDVRNGLTVLQGVYGNKSVYISSLGNEDEYFFETYDLDRNLIDIEVCDKACAVFALSARY